MRKNELPINVDDAKDFCHNFINELVEQLIDKGEISVEFQKIDGGERYFNESYVEKEYSLMEAAEILQEYDEHEETDSGLWEDEEPCDAISIQAAFTYGNAVNFAICETIEAINDTTEVADALDKLNEIEDEDSKEATEALNNLTLEVERVIDSM
jgi:hypothetical protein